MEKKQADPDDDKLDSNGSEGSSHGSETPGEAKASQEFSAELQKEMLYLRAEFDNYKKRMLREQDQAIKFANERLIKDLFSIVDHFDLALSHAKPLKARKDDSELSNFLSGIEMTYRELSSLLGRFGVEFIGAPGEKFDPVRHEAISQREVPADRAGTVLDVLQKGGTLQGRLLKPARVVVGKRAEGEA